MYPIPRPNSPNWITNLYQDPMITITAVNIN